MVYQALSPVGEPTVKAVAAPRLHDLNGKTICEVWNGDFRGHITFPIMRELLKKRFPDVKIIPYTEFPITTVIGSTDKLQKRLEGAVALAKERGCDAMITGNGF